MDVAVPVVVFVAIQVKQQVRVIVYGWCSSVDWVVS